MRAWYPALVLAGASLVIALDPWWFVEVTSRLISFTCWSLQWTLTLMEWTFWALKGALQVIEWTEWGVSSGVLILGGSVVVLSLVLAVFIICGPIFRQIASSRARRPRASRSFGEECESCDAHVYCRKCKTGGQSEVSRLKIRAVEIIAQKIWPPSNQKQLRNSRPSAMDLTTVSTVK